ncbi:MAG: O-antigen ligase family protein [Sphingopyxis sp.]|nr:O-antigen ligase family protein [Sphingopyxis sp.]
MPRHRRHPPSARLGATLFLDSQSWLVGLAMCALVSFLLFGGGPNSAGLRMGIMLAMGAACLLVFGSLGGLRRLRDLPLVETLCWAALIAVPLLQLIPLPPGIWTSLPGRGTETQILVLADQAAAWLPITLNRAATLSALAMTLTLGGILLAGITLPDKGVRHLLIAVIACLALSFVVGAVQLSSSGRLLTFYPTSHKGLLLGFFSNRNHQALLIAVSVLVAGYLIGTSRVPPRQRLALFGFYAFVALAGAFGTASRMGLALCVAASFAAPFLFLGATMARKTYLMAAGGGLVATLAGLASLSGTAGRSLDRFGDVGGDYRWTIWDRSMNLIGDYFPYGTGLGSFSDVYQKYERLEWLLPNYVNDAHNDYIQLIIETGAQGLFLLLLVLAVLVRAAVFAASAGNSRRTGSTDLAKLGIAIILLILAHSVVDYPLRRPAIAAIFTLALALIFRQYLRYGAASHKAPDSTAA